MINDLPPGRDPSGPSVIRQMQQDIETLKDQVRRITPESSPTVRVSPTAVGCTFEAVPSVQAGGEESLPTWLP